MRETATVCTWRGNRDAPHLCKSQSLLLGSFLSHAFFLLGSLHCVDASEKVAAVLGVPHEAVAAALVLWGS